jgi:hypothetical protein
MVEIVFDFGIEDGDIFQLTWEILLLLLPLPTELCPTSNSTSDLHRITQSTGDLHRITQSTGNLHIITQSTGHLHKVTQSTGHLHIVTQSTGNLNNRYIVE